MDDFHPVARIFVAHEGRGRRWYRQGGETLQMRTEPGMIEIYEKGLAFDHCRWSGEAGRCVLVEFADTDVQSMTYGDMPRLALRTRHEMFDSRISHTVFALAGEALAGHPNGRLYAQGLSVALLGLMSGSYAAPAPRLGVSSGRLGAVQQRLLLDVIHAELGADLSLKRLADEVGLSPFHFARTFKATFGLTPHAYVQDYRIKAAIKSLQTDHARSIADIAIAFGFASQSHMTELMRRKIGATPREVRQRA
ncbi:AraC family transcriptional regulator [Variovorax robiniae]|uniref:AraC family transcriptional regulator n=1 Tax=Variovorax robiniae TaxID=1836199 RepID=A0ABU8XH83_9BURK